jgi:uncharacterized repeat protein (TIGR01451 family)
MPPTNTPTLTPTATATDTPTNTPAATATPAAFAMTLDVTATSDGTTPITTAHPGDPVVLRIVVTNTGQNTLNALKVYDDMHNSISATCTPAYDQFNGVTLNAGEILTCVADPYFVTFADKNAGSHVFLVAAEANELTNVSSQVTVTVT